LLAAGLTSVGQFDANKISDYHSLIETNVLGFTNLLARIVSIFKTPSFQDGNSRDLQFGSRDLAALPGGYGASKAYINTLIQALSVELRGTGVSVGAFLPGGIDTAMATQSDLRWGGWG